MVLTSYASLNLRRRIESEKEAQKSAKIQADKQKEEEQQIDNFSGSWKLCDDHHKAKYDCEIIKQGSVYDLRVNGSDFILDKKTNELLSGVGGLVTIRYDKSSNHLFLNDTGPLRELCRVWH